MEKISIGKGFLQFHKNPKLCIISRQIYGKQEFRQVVVPIKVLQYANDFREEIQNGEKKRYDSFWMIYEEECNGCDYVCFQKEENGERIGVSYQF